MLKLTTMKNDNLIALDENFEIESRKVEFGVKEELSFNDLTEAEKEEIFGSTMELEVNFKFENIIDLMYF